MLRWLYQTIGFAGTPLDTAIKEGNIEKIKDFSLKEKSDALKRAIASASWKTAEVLLDSKAGIQEEKEEKTPMLISATIAGQSSVIEKLCEAKADSNVEDFMGRTPLIAALWAQSKVETIPQNIQILIEHGADCKVEKEGRTVLMQFFQSLRPHYTLMKPESIIEVLKILIANDADINARDREGKSVLDYANECTQAFTDHPSHLDAVKLLKDAILEVNKQRLQEWKTAKESVTSASPTKEEETALLHFSKGDVGNMFSVIGQYMFVKLEEPPSQIPSDPDLDKEEEAKEKKQNKRL